jgi:hypothetical protein
MDDWDSRHPAPDEVWLADIDRDGVRRLMHHEGLAWLLARNEFTIDKKLEYADAEYKWWPEALAEEARLIDRWAILSPVTNYQLLSYMSDQYDLRRCL